MKYYTHRDKADKIERAKGGHVMGQPEAKVMRRIQAETGLPEEEIRMYKKYRKMLSEAQSPGNTHSVRQNFFARQEQQRIDTSAAYGSTKAMFKQKTMQVLNGDKEMTSRLYKRYAGGLVDAKRPKDFHYRILSGSISETDAMKAIDKTDGMFVFSPDRKEVGFMYEASLLVFLLAYVPQK